MGNAGSNKPIVFVFGTQKGDTDGRRKNLSAINTQVAYLAHERRREKKNRQRAQAKEDAKADKQAPSGETLPSSSKSSSVKVENDVANPVKFAPSQVQCLNAKFVPRQLPLGHQAQIISEARVPPQPPTQLFSSVDTRRPQNDRRESDTGSDSSSDRESFWSISPAARRDSTPGTEISDLTPPAPLQLNGYFDRALDPFFMLPVAASDREQWLVQFYRDWVSIYVQKKSLCFQWLLILAEEFLGMIGGQQDQTKTIERKAKAYRDLNSALKSRVVNRDEGISGIMYAAIVDTTSTSVHLGALDRLINDTGGFEAFLDGPLGIAHPEHVATVYAFGRCPIANATDLENTKAGFLGALKFLHNNSKQELEEKRRIRNRRPWDTLSRQVIDGNGVLVASNQDEHMRYYIKAQQDCFASDSLSSLLNTTLNADGDFTSQARHLACLLQTSLILHEFETDYLVKATFLKRLQYVCQMSTARDHTGKPLLSHAGLLLINSFVRQEVQGYIDRAKVLTKAVKISKAVVDCLKTFGLLQQTTRSMLVSWLRGWLINNDRFANLDFVDLQEADLTVIGEEITDSWLRSASKG
ncbi:hypothetical protein LTR05_003695 [Lithohypha guttulata]|uniref:Uncharacterized protein n=1 Tax=Lithohypha guttulata TaxID=1690604 RepID=A0AAN7T061_9EURO|nr:hypothetical protein LTR05_003695 [Lithohypha guttulata]